MMKNVLNETPLKVRRDFFIILHKLRFYLNALANKLKYYQI